MLESKGDNWIFLKCITDTKNFINIIFPRIPPYINALLHFLHPAFKYVKEASLAELSQDPLHGLFEALFIVKTLAC